MSLSLEEIRDTFRQWRSLGKRSGRVTNLMKDMVLALLSEHPIHAVSQAIEFPVATIQKWIQTKTKKDDKSFVVLPKPNIPKVGMAAKKEACSTRDLSTTPYELTLTLPQGLKLSLPSQPIKETIQLVRAFAEEFASCSI